MLARMAASLAANLQAAHVLNIIEGVRTELGHYYITIASVNPGLGVAISYRPHWRGCRHRDRRAF